MTQLSVEGLKEFNKLIYQEEEENQSQKQAHQVSFKIKSDSSNGDHEEFITESPFRSSDPTMINRHRIIGFEKTGDLLKKMKRELSTQAFEKASDRGYNKINDKISTQHSYCPINSNEFPLMNWQKESKDEMTQAIMDEYQKQILRLKAELEDIKEEKRQIKQTLQKQRRFYMSEMYSKQLILEQNQFQMDKLRGQIQKHINLQYQFQQKIRLLQLQNAQFKYQLEGWMNSSRQNSVQMEPIYQENQDPCNNSNGISPKNKRESNKMFMSLDNGFVKNNITVDQDPFQIMRLAHERQILKYERQIKSIKDFYENKLKALRKSMTPQKGKTRKSINIMEQYICPDTISCESQTRPQNLRNMLRQQFNQGKSAKKVDDTASFATTKYFKYPQNSKNKLNGQDLFLREQECSELEIKCVDSFIEEQKNEQSKLRSFLTRLIPSKQFIKGFSVGGVASGILTFMAYRNWLKN